MNPLVQSCLEISRAGYEKRNHVEFRYDNPRLVSLGNFLLNNSNLKHTFRLQEKRHDPNVVAICFGGGIDSYTAMFHALAKGREVRLIWMTYGQACAGKESLVFNGIGDAKNGFASKLAEPFEADFETLRTTYGVNLDFKLHPAYEDVQILPRESNLKHAWEDYIIPARNLVLAAVASNYASEIWIVANRRNDETVGTPDKTTRFYRESSALFTEFYGQKTIVTSPFLHLSKLEATRAYLAGGGSMEALKATFSCYTPVTTEPYACGRCYACYKRYQLFQALNTEYNFAEHPKDDPKRPKYEAQEKAKRG
jgi:7-cyano-7-deazaguanine synthase in queuosine biosynthesis